MNTRAYLQCCTQDIVSFAVLYMAKDKGSDEQQYGTGMEMTVRKVRWT